MASFKKITRHIAALADFIIKERPEDDLMATISWHGMMLDISWPGAKPIKTLELYYYMSYSLLRLSAYLVFVVRRKKIFFFLLY